PAAAVERPAEARMQAEGVRRRGVAGIVHFKRNLEPRLGKLVFNREAEGERIDRTRRLIIGQDEAGLVRLLRFKRKSLRGGKAVQAERILTTMYSRAVPGPADDGEEKRADLIPDFWIARPEQIAPGDAPTARLCAFKRNLKRRFACTKLHAARHLRKSSVV